MKPPREPVTPQMIVEERRRILGRKPTAADHARFNAEAAAAYGVAAERDEQAVKDRHLSALELAGIPADRRGIVLDELTLLFEAYKASAPTEKKPLEDFRRIQSTAAKLLDLLESLPAGWRLSLGTVVDKHTGEWNFDPIDWRPSLTTLAEQSAALQRIQDGKPPAAGRPVERIQALLFSIVLIWEREMPNNRGVVVNNDKCGGALFEMVRTMLTTEKVRFQSPLAIGVMLYEQTGKRRSASVTNITEFRGHGLTR